MSQCQKCKAMVNQKWVECLVCGCPVDGCELSSIESIPMPKPEDPETEHVRAEREAIVLVDGEPDIGPVEYPVEVKMDSSILGATVDVLLWPDRAEVDGVQYTNDELKNLLSRNRDRGTMVAAHEAKRTFGGDVLDRKQKGGVT
jgi:hypothetical protein